MHSPSLSRRSPKKTLEQELATLNQTTGHNFQGFFIPLTPDDLEREGDMWVVKEEIKAQQMDLYRVFLEQEIIQSTRQKEDLTQEIENMSTHIATIKVYTKEERRVIAGAYREAQKNWLSVAGFKNHPEYAQSQEANRLALEEINTVASLISRREELEDRKKVLISELELFETDLDGLNLESGLVEFQRHLDAVKISQDVENVGTQEANKKPFPLVSKKTTFTVATILLGAAVGAFTLTKKASGDAPEQQIPAAISYGDEKQKVEFLLGLDKMSIVTSLKQLEQHGNVGQFETEVKNTLKRNFQKVFGSQDRGTFSAEGNEHITYRSIAGGHTEVHVGVDSSQVGLAIAVYLTRIMREKNIANSLRQEITTAQLITRGNQTVTTGGDSFIRRQNAELILQSMIQTSLVDIRESMTHNGYSMNMLTTKLISEGTGGGQFLQVGYTIAGKDYTMQFSLD